MTAGPGRERLVITRGARVTIRVNAFSGTPQLQIGASLSVNMNGTLTKLSIDSHGLRSRGSIWRGVVIEGEDLRVINEYGY